MDILRKCFVFLSLLATGYAVAADDMDHAIRVPTPIARPAFYDDSGFFFLQLDPFIYGLFLSQTRDTTDPVEFNDLPLYSLDDRDDAYDWLLKP